MFPSAAPAPKIRLARRTDIHIHGAKQTQQTGETIGVME